MPQQVAVDANGNVYIADAGNNRILAETPSGSGYTQSTVPTSGLNGPNGVAVDTNGNLYIADSGNGRVLKETRSGNSYTESVISSTNGDHRRPQSVAVDGNGNVYVADPNYAALFKEAPAGNSYSESIISVEYNYSGSAIQVASDQNGNLYVVTGGGDNGPVVLKAVPSGGNYVLSEVASFGANGIAVDGSGDVFLSYGSRVLEEVPAGQFYSQLTVDEDLTLPTGLAADSNGNLYVADFKNNAVVKDKLRNGNFGSVDVGGTSAKVSLIYRNDYYYSVAMGSPAVLTQGSAGMDFQDAGTGSCNTNGPGYTYGYGDSCTVDVVFAPKAPGGRYGAVEITDSSGDLVASGYVQGMGTGPEVTFLPGSQSTLSLNGITVPNQLTVDAAGNIYVADCQTAFTATCGVFKETWNGSGYTQTPVVTYVSGANYQFDFAGGIAVDGGGNVFIADPQDSQVVEASPSGSGYSVSVPFPNKGTVWGVAVDGAGNVYIGSTALGLVKETPSYYGYVETTVAGGTYAWGIAVDGAGNLYVGNSTTSLFKETPSNGSYTQTSIATNPNGYRAVAVDGSGNVYATQALGHNVYKETWSGVSYAESIVATIGQNTDEPEGVAVDSSGNAYIAVSDFDNPAVGSVLKVDVADSPILHFAATAVGHTSTDSPQTVTIANAGNAALNIPILTPGSNPSVPSGFTLNDGASSPCPLVDAGSSSPGTLAVGSSCELSISFTPQSASDISGWLALTYDVASETTPSYVAQNVPLIVAGAPITPKINWPPPVAIDYGTPLSGAQLNATADVPGSFSYSLSAGTVLPAGSHTINVTFTPSDAVDFTSAIASVTLAVNQVNPTLAWSTPFAITYGAALSATQLNATASVPGSFSYSPASGAVVGAGSQTLTATFTPTDAIDYASATGSVTLMVNQATPIITWPQPTAITYGTALGASQLNATATAQGSFAYSPAAGTILTAGYQTLAAAFTPADASDYTTATANTYLQVNQATPTVTWSNPAAITYGTPLGAPQLDATASVPGSFAYSPASGAVLNAGTASLTLYFYPTDSTDYSYKTALVTLVVNKATPLVAWPTPVAIPYGTALSAAQLDAIASTPGAMTYTPAAGTVLNAGTQMLRANFAPADTVDYFAASATANLLINKAAPVMTATASPSGITTQQSLTVTVAVADGSASQVPTGSVTLKGGGYTSLTTTLVSGQATIDIPAGSLAAGNDSLTVTYTPDSASAGNFTTAAQTIAEVVTAPLGTASATVTVTPSATTIADSQSLGVTITVAGAAGQPTPTGTVGLTSGTYTAQQALANGTASFNIAAGALPDGSDTLTSSYSGDATYASATGTTNVTVSPIALTVPAPSSVSPGADGTATATLTAGSGYSGIVNLTCALSSSPTGAVSLPTCSVNPASLTMKAGGSDTATVTVATTAASTTALVRPLRRNPWGVGGGALLVGVVFFWLPSRRRWMAMLGLVSLAIAVCASGCGGGGSGTRTQSTGPATAATTAGSYTFTLTGSDSANAKITTSATVTITVQ